MADSNVIDFKPPEPPGPSAPKSSGKRKPRKIHPDIQRALQARQATIWNATAILDLIDYAQPSRDGMSWKDWNAVLMSIEAAAELLHQVQDLNEPEELAKVGKSLHQTD